MIRAYEGKPVAKGKSKGDWNYVKGTGKYEGIKGGGTWSSGYVDSEAIVLGSGR